MGGKSRLRKSNRTTQSSKPPQRKSKAVSNKQSSDYSDTICEICRKGDGEDKMLLCDKCDRGYHMYCLRPVVVRVPAGKWFCVCCSKEDKVKEFPLVQTKIIDFFRIRRSPTRPIMLLSEFQKYKKRSSRLVVTKKRRRLLPFTPTKDAVRRLQQMASLATALTTVGVQFSDELTYVPGMAPRSANRAAMEKGGMQINFIESMGPGLHLHRKGEHRALLGERVMSREDKTALELCKAMCKKGEWPPLFVVYDSLEGFTVEADSIIKDLTIITEYTGDVDYWINRETDDGDSMMSLLFTEDSSKNLVICPDKRGNIARFINGINNHTTEGRKKQNLKCVRYNVDGESRVLLVAIKDIAKGERLYYDYNGYEQEYPTEHFV
eukprot:Gb_33312 [translate_table: standard]